MLHAPPRKMFHIAGYVTSLFRELNKSSRTAFRLEELFVINSACINRLYDAKNIETKEKGKKKKNARGAVSLTIDLARTLSATS